MMRPATSSETGVGKAPRHESRESEAPSVARLYGDLAAASLGEVRPLAGHNPRWTGEF